MVSTYETLRVLGRGSYGTAVLARDRCQSGEQLRVLKEVDISQMLPEACHQARKEVEVLRSLQHVNVVAYHATFVELGRLYIVMEYADGGNLAEAIRNRQSKERERFAEEEALSIFSQACLALQHIHSRHVLHRDLKSQNIFLTKQGLVKLGDFGIAKMLENTDAEAITVIGTPSYLAPEVCDSQPYGTKADVWSLGVVLYELLTLELPFKARSLAALVVKIVTGQHPPVLPSLCSQEGRQLVDELLQKNPEQRLSTDEILNLPIISHTTGLMQFETSADDGSEGSTRAPTRSTSVDSASSRGSTDRVANFNKNTPVVPSYSINRLWNRRRLSSKARHTADKVDICPRDHNACSKDVKKQIVETRSLEQTLPPRQSIFHIDAGGNSSCERRRVCAQFPPLPDQQDVQEDDLASGQKATPVGRQKLEHLWKDEACVPAPGLLADCTKEKKQLRQCDAAGRLCPLPLPQHELGRGSPRQVDIDSCSSGRKLKLHKHTTRPPRRLKSLAPRELDFASDKGPVQFPPVADRLHASRSSSMPCTPVRPSSFGNRRLSPLRLAKLPRSPSRPSTVDANVSLGL